MTGRFPTPGFKILLPVKFHKTSFRDSRGIVENVSGNQRPVHPSWFSIFLKNTSLVEDVEFLLPQVSANSVKADSEKNSKMSQPIRGWGGGGSVILFLQNINLEEDVEFFASYQLSAYSLQQFQRRSKKCLSQSVKPVQPSCFSNRLEKHKLGRGR